jgi:hypothetical protein
MRGRHRYNESLLREAHKRVRPATCGADFWRAVAAEYRHLTGHRLSWVRVMGACHKRGLRALIHGSSRSTSRWGACDA